MSALAGRPKHQDLEVVGFGKGGFVIELHGNALPDFGTPQCLTHHLLKAFRADAAGAAAGDHDTTGFKVR